MAAAHFDLRARLATGEPFLFSWMSIPSAGLAAQVARLPFDGVCLDMQHGMIGFSDAVPMIAAINAAGKPAIVRALWNDPAIPGQALDAGAVAVIAPMVNSRAQAEALVQAAKYPPMGGRSWGGYTALQASGLTPGEYLREANRMTMVFAMIETVRGAGRPSRRSRRPPASTGCSSAPATCRSRSRAAPASTRPARRRWPPWRRWSRPREANNLVAGAFGGSAEVIKAYLGLGFTFIAAAVDVDLLQTGAAALHEVAQGRLTSAGFRARLPRSWTSARRSFPAMRRFSTGSSPWR